MTGGRAFNRVNKELVVLDSLSKMLLAFFKKENDSDDNKEVLCDGRAVKMFSDMIRKSFKDEDFISGNISIIIHAGHCKILVFFAVLKGLK